jgi:peroxiredoxin
MLALSLAGALLVLAIVGIALFHRGQAPPRVVTLTPADRAASPALIQAAEEVGFFLKRGGGAIESQPAVTGAVNGSGGLLATGSQAPAFALRTPTGKRVSLASFRGKATLLEFFATGCPHCAAEAPHLRTLYASLPRSRYGFVSVNADSEQAPSVFAYHVYFSLPFAALLDPGGRVGSFAQYGSPGKVTSAYRVGVFPTFYVLDPRGRITWAAAGEQPDALLREELVHAATGSPIAAAGKGAGGGGGACTAGCTGG